MNGICEQPYIHGLPSSMLESVLLPHLLLPRPTSSKSLHLIPSQELKTMLTTLQKLRSVSRRWKKWVDSTLEWTAWRVARGDTRLRTLEWYPHRVAREDCWFRLMPRDKRKYIFEKHSFASEQFIHSLVVFNWTCIVKGIEERELALFLQRLTIEEISRFRDNLHHSIEKLRSALKKV